MKRFLGTLLALTLLTGCTPEAEGTVISKKCTKRLGDQCLRVDIKVKYSDGHTTTHNKQRKTTKNCDKGAKYPKCIATLGDK